MEKFQLEVSKKLENCFQKQLAKHKDKTEKLDIIISRKYGK